MMSEIPVSVVIPAYNAEATLVRALDSVIGQTYPASEIIVVDDASSDETAKIAQTYQPQGVKLLVLRQRQGAAAARNAGVGMARSPWIAFLDADDEWLPSKLEEQMVLIREDPGIALVFCASQEVSCSGELLGDTFRGLKPTCGPLAWKRLLEVNFIATPTVVASHALLSRLGGFDERLPIAEDQDMWIRLALAGRLAYVPQCLARVHVRADSLSVWRLEDQKIFVMPMIERHLVHLDDRLTRIDRCAIRGARLRSIGLNACYHGKTPEGLAMIAHSIVIGHRPVRGLYLLLRLLAAASLRTILRLESAGSTQHSGA